MTCVLLLCAIITQGCSVRLEESPLPTSFPALQPSEVDLTPRIQIEVSLYFLNRSQTKLELETRTLDVGQNESPELAIVHAVMDGPRSETLLPVGAGLAADRVEVMPDLINVYLSRTSSSVRQWNLTVFKLALSTALIDYSGVRYVNVLVDGESPGYTTASTGEALPTGVTSRPGELTEELSILAQRSSGVAYDAYAALYFLDQSESWLLPEIRRITVQPNSDAVDAIIGALSAGPSNRYSLRRSLDSDVKLLDHEFVEEPGGRMLRLVFDRIPTVYTASFVNGEEMSGASLAYTLVGFVPGIRGVQITDQEDSSNVVTYLPDECSDLIGNRISVCLPNTPDGATMTSVARVVPQAQCNDLYMILSVLFSGPVNGDSRDIWPAAPEGISIRSILDVYRADDIIVVNLDGTVSEILRRAGADNERVLFFSVVNTLTSIKGVRSVLFLEEGERREYIGVETVCVLDPILRNPGVIR